MKILKVMAAAAAAILITAAPASASSVHLKGGANAEPTFTDHGLYLEAEGLLSGLGEGDVVVNLDTTGFADSTCTNPGSGVHQPAGQNPAPTTGSGTQTIPNPQNKNGNTPFDVFTTPPVTPVSGAPGCPNPNWIQDINDVEFATATITVEQAGQLVLTVYCEFDPLTEDGTVPARTVTCTSS